jgi:hypothetical protein
VFALSIINHTHICKCKTMFMLQPTSVIDAVTASRIRSAIVVVVDAVIDVYSQPGKYNDWWRLPGDWLTPRRVSGPASRTGAQTAPTTTTTPTTTTPTASTMTANRFVSAATGMQTSPDDTSAVSGHGVHHEMDATDAAEAALAAIAVSSNVNVGGGSDEDDGGGGGVKAHQKQCPRCKSGSLTFISASTVSTAATAAIATSSKVAIGAGGKNSNKRPTRSFLCTTCQWLPLMTPSTTTTTTSKVALAAAATAGPASAPVTSA